MITKPELYLYPLKTLVDKELISVLRLARDTYGGRRSLIRTLEWDPRIVTRLLDEPPAPNIPGSVVLCLPVQFLEGASFSHVKQTVEACLVAAIDHLGSNYQVAAFLGTDEWTIRRIKSRARHLP